MTDPTEKLARALAQRQRHLSSPRRRDWESVARGERSAAEVTRARAEAGDSAEEIELAQKLFAPYDAERREALATRLREQSATPKGGPVEELAGALAQRRRSLSSPRRRDWESVARGERSATEVASARAEAGDSAEEIELAQKLFAPYDAERREALAARVQSTRPKGGPVGVVRPPPQRSRHWPLAAALLAIAAAVPLFLAWPRSRPPPGPLSPASLPSYTLEPWSSASADRGPSPSEPSRLWQETPFEWIIEPEVPVSDDIGVWVFFIADGEQEPRHVLDATASELIHINHDGWVIMTGRTSALGLEAGSWQVVVAIVAAGEQHPTASEAATLEDADTTRVVRFAIELGKPPPLPVWVAGCKEMTSAPLCLRRPSTEQGLSLWLDGAWDPEELSLTWNGEPLVLSPEIHDGRGLAWRVDTPTTRGRLSLHHSDARRFDLELVELSPAFAPARLGLDAALPEGREAVGEFLASVDEQALTHYEVYLLRCGGTGWAYLQQDDAVLEAPAELEEEAEEHGDLSCISGARIRAINAMLYSDPMGAAVVDHIDALDATPSRLQSRISADYYRGLRHLQVGELERALVALTRSARLAQGAAVHGSEAEARVVLAMTFERLGRHSLARVQRERILEIPELRPGLQMEIEESQTWVEVLRGEDDPSADASPELERWLERYASQGSERDQEWINDARLNKVLADLQHGRRSQARAEFRRVDERALAPHAVVWYRLARARLTADPKLRRERLAEAMLAAELSLDPDGPLRVIQDLARLEQEVGASEAALEHYRRAEALELEISRGLWFGSSRGSFLSAHSRSRSRHLELLIELERPQEALCLVLRARARHLNALILSEHLLAPGSDAAREYVQRRRAYIEEGWHGLPVELEQLTIEERERAGPRLRQEIEALHRYQDEAMASIDDAAPAWQCARARPHRTDEGLLTMYPTSTGDGWWYLLDRDGAVEIFRGEGTSRPPLGDRVAGLHTLTVVPVGRFDSTLDTGPHALVRRQSLGLGSNLSQRATDGGRAVIVTGQGGLSKVEAETTAVAASLTGLGWSVGSEGLFANEPPALFHYAGHGVYEGLDGWRSFLGVEGQPVVQISHLLARQRAPAVVVLGACKTGATTTEGDLIDGGMNMATAFLLAGAQLVIAPSGDVDDDLALAFAEQLYAEPPSPDVTVEELVTHMQAALREAHRADSRFRDWTAWTP